MGVKPAIVCCCITIQPTISSVYLYTYLYLSVWLCIPKLTEQYGYPTKYTKNPGKWERHIITIYSWNWRLGLHFSHTLNMNLDQYWPPRTVIDKWAIFHSKAWVNLSGYPFTLQWPPAKSSLVGAVSPHLATQEMGRGRFGDWGNVGREYCMVTHI